MLFNLFVSNVPGPQLPLYIAGARVEGIYPVSAVTDMTGGLNITLFSYDGSLDFGLIACREMVPGRVEPDRLPRRTRWPRWSPWSATGGRERCRPKPADG